MRAVCAAAGRPPCHEGNTCWSRSAYIVIRSVAAVVVVGIVVVVVVVVVVAVVVA